MTTTVAQDDSSPDYISLGTPTVHWATSLFYLDFHWV